MPTWQQAGKGLLPLYRLLNLSATRPSRAQGPVAASLQPHADGDPFSLPVFPLIHGIRLKPQLRVQLQAGNVLIET
jgi:hypothetical protein